MDFMHSRAQSPSQPSAQSNYHHPYFTPAEVKFLSEKQRGKMTETQEERVRQNACGFLEAMGARIGFPRKTIATAQSLYHRFHLFFPRNLKDCNYFDVALAALYVSTKMHDTLKKPRELLAVSYAIRAPDSVAKLINPAGGVDIDAMDPQVVEHDRQKLLAVERSILETICFNFTSRMPFPYVIKLGRALGASKKVTQSAWRVAIDSHRTLVPIQYPPHTVALGSIYVAALLATIDHPDSPESSPDPSSRIIAKTLGQHGEWERKYQAQVEDLEAIAHTIVDLLIHGAGQNPSANISPRTPSSPSPHPSPRNQYLTSSHPNNAPVIPYKTDQLIRLKILLRRTEHTPRQQQSLGRKGERDPSSSYGIDEIAKYGRSEGTVRYLFGPKRVVGQGV